MRLLESDTHLNRHSWYEQSLTRPAPLAAAAGEIACDVLVVGGGFAGLSASLQLAKRGYRVVLLEGEQLCWAASGRNGGQALPGFACGMQLMEKQLGLDSARQMWQMSCEALTMLQQSIADHGIDCDWVSGAITCATDAGKVRNLKKDMEYLQRRFGYRQQWFGPDRVRQLIASSRYQAAVLESLGGHLHPLKYGLGLARACSKAGVVMHEHSVVTNLVYRGEKVIAMTEKAQVRADFALLAGNYLLPQFAPRLARPIGSRIMPVGTYIGATAPLGETLARQLIPGNHAVCDNAFVLDYFRFAGDTSLLFGGRVSYSTRTPRRLAEVMQRRILRVFPQLAHNNLAEVQMAWGGFVDITANRAPDFGRIAKNVYYLQGFSGHGVAITNLAGLLVAEAIAGQAERFDRFARIRHTPFPGGWGLRTALLTLAMSYYRLKDVF